MQCCQRGTLSDTTGQITLHCPYLPGWGSVHTYQSGPLPAAPATLTGNLGFDQQAAAAKLSPANAAAPSQQLRARREVGAAAATEYTQPATMLCRSQCASAEILPVRWGAG